MMAGRSVRRQTASRKAESGAEAQREGFPERAQDARGKRSAAFDTGLLLRLLHRFRYRAPAATCQSGYGAVCKTVYPGSIPGVASSFRLRETAHHLGRNAMPDSNRHF